MIRKKVFVALSGGVDSSVAAALLRERGFDVVGIHIKMWSPADARKPETRNPKPETINEFGNVCRQQVEDRYDAMRVCAKLEIPFQTWDFTEEYRRAVVEYMIGEYAAGITPNPDVMCNSRIKFGLFLERAVALGADYIATGHYARLMRKSEIPARLRLGARPLRVAKRVGREVQAGGRNPKSETISKFEIRKSKLLAARDPNKDQSYFLWTLTQEQLQRCLFPIGEYTKPEVRELARKFGLPTAEKPDSQGICFIGEIDLRQFLKNYIPERRGRVLTTSGKAVGEHSGVEFYTIGQREGIGIGGGIPYYVAEKDVAANTLVVAEGPYDEKLFRKELIATDVNWISEEGPEFPLRCEARIRYRQPLQHCTVTRIRADNETDQNGSIRSYPLNDPIRIRVLFDEAQRAVTPGQSIVFYRNNPFDPSHGREMLGGGIIVEAK